MTLRLLGLLSLVLAAPAFAYDGMEADVAVCMNPDSAAAGEVVAACTRLIDNAQAENATIGMFYGIRATVNDDAESNCRDARKSYELADDANIRDLSQQLIDQYC